MNRIKVVIQDITSSGGIMLIDLETNNTMMSALLIDAFEPPAWLSKGNKAWAVFKETEVSIAKDLQGKISSRNKLPCIVQGINRGVLMSIVSLKFGDNHINAAITTRSVDALDLNTGDHVLALIKSNEMSLLMDV